MNFLAPHKAGTPVKYKIQFAPDLTTVAFKGHIDERIGEALAEIRPQVKTAKAVFDLAGIDLINSIGISTWIAHLAAFKSIDLHYVRAPYAFVSLCQILPMLAVGRCLDSFQIRFHCGACNDDDERLGWVGRDETLATGKFKTLPCPRCKKPMEADPHDEDFKALFQRP